ncbi:hypothetical protein [Metabacillus idriensis]
MPCVAQKVLTSHPRELEQENIVNLSW